ncbi:putative succinate--CoA ligase (ADP-forming) [Helianthus annuus]|nr:putative succinate--CoA ligase (ADP-forming) [Helianthus annuus]
MALGWQWLQGYHKKLHGGTPANFLDVGGNASEGQVPVVVRLEGTNVDQGKRIPKESGMTLITAEDLDDAAEKAIAIMGCIVNGPGEMADANFGYVGGAP